MGHGASGGARSGEEVPRRFRGGGFHLASLFPFGRADRGAAVAKQRTDFFDVRRFGPGFLTYHGF
jgi:hypothetical protein